MKIKSVKLINYKSIGDYDESEIIIEPEITAIIGKNESGKSNVIEGLSNISFTKKNNGAFVGDNINRNNRLSNPVTNIKYIITLEPSEVEQKDKNIIGESHVIITKDDFEVRGSLKDYYKYNIKRNVDELVELIEGLGQNPFNVRDQNLINFNHYINAFKEEGNLNTVRINEGIELFENWSSRIPDIGQRETLSKKIKEINELLEGCKSLFPQIFYRKSDKVLKSSYKLEEVKNELTTPNSYPNSLLWGFVKLIDVSPDEFIDAVQAGATGSRTGNRDRINRNIDAKINSEFNDFYGVEQIELRAGFDSNTVTFEVKSNNATSMLLAERSDGLRWYLNLFIDARANDISDSNVIYLLDEPGIRLHVNAQKELLRLFKRLTSKGNQVVYTTHSPYMLNIENGEMHRIRAVVKDNYGYTRIYKTAYDSRINKESQKDTLTPIISAIGMNLECTFGPAINKINIVTEGMSDYIYIHAIARILSISLSQYVFIPSVGVTNSLNICSILHGWGCPFIALFDYDSEGVEKGGEVLRKEYLYQIGKEYIYLRDVTVDDIESKTYKNTKVTIEDLVTEDELEYFCKTKNISNDIGKPLKAKLLANAIEEENYIPSDECINKFKDLFRRIDEARKRLQSWC